MAKKLAINVDALFEQNLEVEGIITNQYFIQGINTNKITVSDTEPTNPEEGDLWIEPGE